MPRAKGGYKTRQRRNRVLKRAEGFWGKKKNCFRSAQEAVDRYAQRLACQVPEGQVDARQGRLQHRPAAPEGTAEDVLPEVLDARGVGADEERTEVLEGTHVALLVPRQQLLVGRFR